jgi:phage repressor protein C with HTH and peptisase S24 domain
MRWPLGIYRVSGDSMQPAYKPGDTLIGTGWFRPEVGQVVIVKRASHVIIKRITRMSGELLWIEGDNPSSSTDSRMFGPVSRFELKAKIIRKLD